MRLGRYLLWAPIASGVGIVVLLGLLVRDPAHPVVALRSLLLRWAMILAAGALLVGLLNLLSVHWTKINLAEPGWGYSTILLLALLATFGAGLVFGPDNEGLVLVFNYVQLPIEASLTGLLAISLTLAGFRLLARRRDLISLTFVAVALVVLLGTAPWPAAGDAVLREFVVVVQRWLTQVVGAGGARGLLLGVALGAISTSLRVLLAADRPYGD